MKIYEMSLGQIVAKQFFRDTYGNNDDFDEVQKENQLYSRRKNCLEKS